MSIFIYDIIVYIFNIIYLYSTTTTIHYIPSHRNANGRKWYIILFIFFFYVFINSSRGFYGEWERGIKINYRLIYFHLPTPRGYEFFYIIYPFLPPRHRRYIASSVIYINTKPSSHKQIIIIIIKTHNFRPCMMYYNVICMLSAYTSLAATALPLRMF